jgi:hypothetical protein
VSVGFEILEERADEHRVEIRQLELGGRLAALPMHEAEQQPERVAVGGDRVRTGLALVQQSLCEEAFE